MTSRGEQLGKTKIFEHPKLFFKSAFSSSENPFTGLLGECIHRSHRTSSASHSTHRGTSGGDSDGGGGKEAKEN